MASFDMGSCSSSADVIFRTQLRPALHNPRAAQARGEPPVSFWKPAPTAHQTSPTPPPVGQLCLQPFGVAAGDGGLRRRTSEEVSAQSPSRLQLLRVPLRPLTGQHKPLSSMRMSRSCLAVSQVPGLVTPTERIWQDADEFEEHFPMPRSSASRERRGRSAHVKASFSEEPDDARVHLPAHRMGDQLPRSPIGRSPGFRSSGLGRSFSEGSPRKHIGPPRKTPSLVLGAQRKPLHALPGQEEQEVAMVESLPSTRQQTPAQEWSPGLSNWNHESIKRLLPPRIHQRVHMSLLRQQQEEAAALLEEGEESPVAHVVSGY